MATAGTPKKKRAFFLKAFEEAAAVADAAKRAGVNRVTVYKWRESDEGFARQWADVEERSTELLEREAVRRATDGSDVLLIFLLKSRRPERYRDHHRGGAFGPGGRPVG